MTSCGGGVADVAVPPPGFNWGGSRVGRVDIFDAVSGQGVGSLRPEPGEYLTWAVAPTDDLTRDGIADIVVGTILRQPDSRLRFGWALYDGWAFR